MKRKAYCIIKWSIIILFAVFFINLFVCFPITKDMYANLLENTLTVSSIITAIVFAFLFSKVFQIQSEKEKRQIKIDNLSFKLSNFRRLIYHIFSDNKFWKDYSVVNKFKKEHPDLTFNIVHDDKNDYVPTTSEDFYLAVNELVNINHSEFWIYNTTQKISYSIDEIAKFHKPINQIWYYLEHKWLKFGQNHFNEQLIIDKSDNFTIIELIKSIKNEQIQQNIDRHKIASICDYFYNKIIPDLYELKDENAKGLPFFTKSLLLSQIIIMIFGVIIPLTLTTLNLDFELAKYFLFGSVLLTTMSVLWLALNVKQIIDNEMNKYR